MKHVSILIPRGNTSVVNIGGTHQIFSMVNPVLQQMRRNPVFDIHLVGVERTTEKSPGIFSVKPDCMMSDVEKTDLIIIPAIFDEISTAKKQNQEFIPWILHHYKNGAEVASLCVAAFFLAETGLLDGKQCSTHWMHANNFRKLYPDVVLVDDKIMTEEDGIYTSGGAYAFLNLLLYLIEKNAGRDVAVHISKAFNIDIDKDSQSPFIIFEGQKDHDDKVVKKAQETIEKNYGEKLTVNDLVESLAISRRSLERRFKKATSNTLVEYIQRVKVEVAKRSFETTRKNVNEIMYDVGYSDTKSFRTVFRKVTGLTPFEYRKKYH
ncbi:MAG: helix-turn-helix domain-containing protein [Balneolaceae bacterium]